MTTDSKSFLHLHSELRQYVTLRYNPQIKGFICVVYSKTKTKTKQTNKTKKKKT